MSNNDEAEKAFMDWATKDYPARHNCDVQSFLAAWKIQQTKIDELTRQNHPIMCMASDTGAITFPDQQSKISRLDELLREAREILNQEGYDVFEVNGYPELVEKIDKEIGK